MENKAHPLTEAEVKHWSCSAAKCKKNAVYVLVTPRVQNEKTLLTKKGFCGDCAIKEAKKLEIVLPPSELNQPQKV